MGRYQDLSGQKFNHLTVIERTDDYVSKCGCRVVMYKCQCDCGNIAIVRANSLKSGITISCGYIRKSSMKGVNLEDLTNQRFGRWTVLYRVDSIVEPSGRKATVWRCRCNCGNEQDVRASSLKNGSSKSCGCLKADVLTKTRDLKNERFGRWLVLDRAPDKIIGQKYKRAQKMWHCKCDCGNENDVSEQSLVQGKSVSCGCYRKERVQEKVTYQDLTGKQFHHWTVLYRLDDRFYPCGGRVQMWQCRCCCGKEAVVNVNALKSGDSKSCGCQSVYSSLEEYVCDYCVLNQIEYDQHVYFDDLISAKGRHLSYDFLIKRNGKPLFLIECQGEQHYRAVKYFGGEERFLQQQCFDAMKAEYAVKIGLPLILIPYWISNYDEIANMLTNELSKFVDEENKQLNQY